MPKEFDRKAIEALEVKTIEAIEAITWPLVVGDNLKATDEQGDLVSLLVENDKIVYDRMSDRGEMRAEVVHFELPLNNEAQEELANVE